MLLDRDVARIVVSEICPDQRDALKNSFEDQPVEVREARPGDASILAEPCDILAPNALGGVLGPKTIPGIRAPIVCGAANNQLVDGERDGQALADRDITYVPDFVANRMGIVLCANEQYGYVGDDPRVRRHLDPGWNEGIHATVMRVLASALESDESPMFSANRLADERAVELHPIWGHRSREIVASLLEDGWENAGD